MKGFGILLNYSVRRVRTLVLTMSVILGVFQVFLIVIAKSLQSTHAFEQIGALMPPFVREVMGPSFATFMSFGGMVTLGYFHLAVMGSLVGLMIALATLSTSEIEVGFMDLILSRPLARHRLLTRTVAIILLATMISLGMMILGTWVGLRTLAPRDVEWPSAHLIGSLALNLALLMLCWGAVALVIGSSVRRRAVAGGITGVLALTTFLLDYIARSWKPAESIAWISPFRYYSPLDLLMGLPLSSRNVVVLVGIALLGFGLSYLLFSRRDISH
ncbi:MAG: hypothetical protein PHX83_15560 [Acidobacteriia bacterium]|nr:hypothetical protein [Terriglobia bacterium]